jgi:hypothetical protein
VIDAWLSDAKDWDVFDGKRDETGDACEVYRHHAKPTVLTSLVCCVLSYYLPGGRKTSTDAIEETLRVVKSLTTVTLTNV